MAGIDSASKAVKVGDLVAGCTTTHAYGSGDVYDCGFVVIVQTQPLTTGCQVLVRHIDKQGNNFDKWYNSTALTIFHRFDGGLPTTT